MTTGITVEQRDLTPPEGNDDVLVRSPEVSKRFCRSLKKSSLYGVQDIGSELVGRGNINL